MHNSFTAGPKAEIEQLRISILLDGTAAGANQRSRSPQNRPATVLARFYFFAEHAANHGSTTSRPTGPGADAGSLADLGERCGPCLDRFDHNPLTNLVTQADRFVGIDDSLLSSSFFGFVDLSTPRTLAKF